MNRYNLLFILCVLCISAMAIKSSLAQSYIILRDNQKTIYNSNTFIITEDSIRVDCVADYGRSRFTYLSKALNQVNKTDYIELGEKLLQWYPDSMYFTSFSNQGNYIDASHAPQILELKYLLGTNQEVTTQVNNTFVPFLSLIVDFINTLVPEELKIKYSDISNK